MCRMHNVHVILFYLLYLWYCIVTAIVNISLQLDT